MKENGVHPPSAPRSPRRLRSTPARGSVQKVPLKRSRPANPSWHLRLYVAGQSSRSKAAFINLKRICESHLKGRYHITVIDLLRRPRLAQGDQILAIPTVVRRLPKPVRILFGSLSDTARALVGLDLRPAS